MTKASSTPKPTNKQPSMVCIGPYDNPNIEHKPNDAIGFGLTFNMIKNIDSYPFPGSQGSYGWHGSWGPYFRIDPKENLVMILMTQMKGWKYSRKEIFESQVYKAILKN